jgi:ABC-type polysaccharide/polyol phosphate export permease
LFEFIRTLIGNKRLVKELVIRDLKARYVGSSMGFFWSVVFPLLNLVVYTFVFSVLLGQRFGDKAGITDVAIWMLAGIVVWSAFAETLSRATNCLVENANLIQKVVFPAGVLPIYLTISSIVNMTIGIPVVLLGVFYFGYVKAPEEVAQVQERVAVVGTFDPSGGVIQEGVRDPRRAACNTEGCTFEHVLICPDHGDNIRIITPRRGTGKQPVQERDPNDLSLGVALLCLPLLMFLQAIFTAGLGLFLSAFNLIIRDTFHVIGVLVMVWMFSTPIFYPPYMILEPKHNGRYDFILEYNPMYWLIECYRDVMLFNKWPNGEMLGTFAVVALIAFGLGSMFFDSQRKRFPDLL